jgi:hypothetical protein
VNADASEPLRALLDRVEDRHRLAVAQANDEVVALAEVVEHGLGRAALLGECRADLRRPRCL